MRNAPCTRPKFELMNCILTTWHCLLDKNECLEQRGGCQHACVNTEGSFKCSCKTGFKLHSNGKDCVGMSAILFTFTSMVRYYHCGGRCNLFERIVVFYVWKLQNMSTQKTNLKAFKKNYSTFMPHRRSRGILFLSCLSFCHSVLLCETLTLLLTFE